MRRRWSSCLINRDDDVPAGSPRLGRIRGVARSRRVKMPGGHVLRPADRRAWSPERVSLSNKCPRSCAEDDWTPAIGEPVRKIGKCAESMCVCVRASRNDRRFERATMNRHYVRPQQLDRIYREARGTVLIRSAVYTYWALRPEYRVPVIDDDGQWCRIELEDWTPGRWILTAWKRSRKCLPGREAQEAGKNFSRDTERAKFLKETEREF